MQYMLHKSTLGLTTCTICTCLIWSSLLTGDTPLILRSLLYHIYHWYHRNGSIHLNCSSLICPQWRWWCWRPSAIATIKACTILVNSLICASRELIQSSMSDDPTSLFGGSFPCGSTYCCPCGYKPYAPRIRTCVWGLCFLINYTSSSNLSLVYSILLWPNHLLIGYTLHHCLNLLSLSPALAMDLSRSLYCNLSWSLH